MSSSPSHDANIQTTDTLSASISSTMKDPDPLDLSTLLGIHPLPTPLYTIDDCFHAVSASWERVQSKDQDENQDNKSLTPHQRLIATLHRRERVEDVAQFILDMYQHVQDGMDENGMPVSTPVYLSHPSHRQILHQLQSIARNASSSASRVMPTTWTAPLGLHRQMQKLCAMLKMDNPPVIPSHPTLLADVRIWLSVVGEHLQCPSDPIPRQGLFSRPTRWERHGTPASIYGHRHYNRVWRTYRHLQFTCRTALQQQEKQLQHMIQRAGLAHCIPYMYEQMQQKQETKQDDKQHEEENELEDDDSSYVFVAPGGAAVPYWEFPYVSSLSLSSSSSLPPLTDSHTIAFIAYQTAMLHRRTEFCPFSSQPTRYDEMSHALLQQCILHSHTTQWIWIAHIHATPEVFHHLSEMELTSLLLTWRSLLHHFSTQLARMWQAISGRCSRTRMIVKRGVDSTAWNICAGAYMTARRHWMQLLKALNKEHILEIECLPKICCLVAGDVAAASHIIGRGLHIDVGICASLPQVWEVLSGRVPCTRSTVEAACNAASADRADEIRDWYQTSTSIPPIAYRVTPHLINGVVQTNNCK